MMIIIIHVRDIEIKYINNTFKVRLGLGCRVKWGKGLETIAQWEICRHIIIIL